MINSNLTMNDIPTTHVSHEAWTKVCQLFLFALCVISFNPYRIVKWHQEGLVIVVIGASGDLAKKKTYPSLLSLFADHLLPRNLVIYGYARSNINSEDLREKLRPYLEKSGLKTDIVHDFLARCYYQPGAGYGDISSWQVLNEKIITFEDEIANNMGVSNVNRLFYFAIPPNVFAETGGAIKTSCMSTKGFSRMIVEKPFGKDLTSCKDILARVRRVEESSWVICFITLTLLFNHHHSLASISTKQICSGLITISVKKWCKI